MQATVSILAEISEDVHETLKAFLDDNPDFDQDQVFMAALSHFLMMNSGHQPAVARRMARTYLDSMFKLKAIAA